MAELDFLNRVLETPGLTLERWAICILVGLLIIPVSEVRKRIWDVEEGGARRARTRSRGRLPIVAEEGRVIGSGDGPSGSIGGLGVRFLVGGDASGGGVRDRGASPRARGALAAPCHRHTRGDGYSFILAGRVDARLGDRVVVGEPGDLIVKPRNEWHTLWNAGDAEARVLEIIPCRLRAVLRGAGRPLQRRTAASRSAGRDTRPIWPRGDRSSVPALIEEQRRHVRLTERQADPA